MKRRCANIENPESTNMKKYKITKKFVYEYIYNQNNSLESTKKYPIESIPDSGYFKAYLEIFSNTKK